MTKEQFASKCVSTLQQLPEGAEAAGFADILAIFIQILQAMLPILQENCKKPEQAVSYLRSTNPREARQRQRLAQRQTRSVMGLIDYRRHGQPIVEALLQTSATVTPEELGWMLEAE